MSASIHACRSSEEARERLVTNFEADKPAEHFAQLYAADDLQGGHVIMLGPDPDSRYSSQLLFESFMSAVDESKMHHMASRKPRRLACERRQQRLQHHPFMTRLAQYTDADQFLARQGPRAEDEQSHASSPAGARPMSHTITPRNLCREAALSALRAFPGGLHVGGGVTPENAGRFLDAGASHVIVTSFVFRNGRLEQDRLNSLVRTLLLSCCAWCSGLIPRRSHAAGLP